MEVKKKRLKLVVDVHLFLVKEGRILLLLRKNTGYADGKYHVPAGHLEAGETVIDALIREAEEEVGVRMKPEDVRLAHVMHNKDGGGRMGWFFEVRRWEREVENREPEKHGEIGWFEFGDLPEEMVDYAREAIKCYRKGEVFSEFGWDG